MKPLARAGIVAVVLALVAIPAVVKLRSGGEARPVEVTVAEQRVLSPTILASGTLTYQTEIKLVSEVIGRVREILVEEGDEVKRGDLLLRLDPAAAQAEVAQLEAALQQSRLAISRQEVTAATQAARFARFAALREQGLIDANSFDEVSSANDLAKVELDTTRQVLRQTEAQLRQARERLAKTEIRSPLDGRVTALFIKIGETAVPSVTSIAGSDLMVVADTSNLFAEVNVNETDVARVGPGQQARIVPAAFPDRAWSGVVETVAVSPRQLAGQSKSYPVRIRLENVGDLQFHTGMSCRAEISTRSTAGEPVLAVPVGAVRYEEVSNRNEKAKASLFVDVGGRAVRREVETGIADDEYIEITRGIAAGDVVVTGPARTLRFLQPGDRLTRAGAEEAAAGPASATAAE